MMKRVLFAAVLSAALASVWTAPIAAQVTTGTIVGTVTDPNGIVPGATVVIHEVNRGTSDTFVTDATGSYTAPFLTPGTYRIEINVSGFKKWVRDGVILQVNQRARVDVTLEVGRLEETTTVVAEAPLLRTDSSEVGTVIEERAIKELPLNGRNFATLVYLMPGITPGQANENLSGASTFNPRGASNFNALGHQANANAWLIDGIDNNEYTFNTVIIAPSVEQVREFKVLSGVFSAEFGRGAGVVSVATKSGSNMLHGTVFEYLRNDAFDARNFFVRKVPLAGGGLQKDPKPPLDRHQFGGAVGGALVIPGVYDGHSRTFFFSDYAGLKEKRGQVFVNTVPTAQTRVGDFSDFRDPNGNLIVIYDPLTTRPNPDFDSSKPVSATNPQFLRDPFSGNIIPQNRINPVGRNVASIYPLPNGAGNFNNYTSTVNRDVTDNVFSGRVDHKVSDKDSFYVRFNWGKFKLDAPQGQAACCLPTPAEAAARFDLGPFVAGIQNTRLTTHGAAFNYARVISPTLINELRTGYAKTVPFTFQSDFGTHAADSLGIRGINVTEFTTGLPNINVPDMTGISGGPAFLPVNPKQFHWQIEDSLVWLKGRHQLKTGYRLVDRYPSPFTNTDTRGTINFGRNYTNNPVTNAGGSGLASLLTGYINNAARGFLLEPYTLRTQEHGLFVQDDFKANPRFTINAGLRYEIFGAETEEHNKIVNFDPVNLRLIYAGEDGASKSVNKKTQRGLAPRLGLTYDLFGDSSTILRTGFGITYFPEQPSASNMIGQQVPYTISQNVNFATNPTDFSAVRTIDDPFPPIVQVKPRTTAELQAANPRVLGHSFENETPYAEQWHLGVERRLLAAMAVELTYAGSAGKHLVFCYNPNEVQPGIGSQESRRLIQPLNRLNNMLQCDPRNRSTYHSGQLKVTQRFSGGLQFLLSYTYGKSLDYGGSAASGGGAVGSPQTVTNLNAGRGPSGFDTRHRAVISGVWEMPWGPGRRWMNDSGVLGAVVGGWQLSGIGTLTTGRPFTVFMQNGVNNGAPSWPDRIGSGKLDHPTVDLWYNPADFKAPPANTYGNTGRGILYAPGHVNVDTSLSKRVTLAGRSNFEFRWDAFNLFNHPGFGFPNQNFDSTTAGRITSTIVDNRSMQFSFKVNF
jgi:Carboxypeptidase regulatory-like domain/TonB dependent receptor-like, beta-barrel/TonB-dependent Receptor Plug Domain